MGRLELEQRLEDELVRVARLSGVLGMAEEVGGTLSLYMNQVRPLWQKALLFPIQILLFRKCYLLVLTKSRLVLCRVSRYKFRQSQCESVEADLTCTLRLSIDTEPTKQRLDYKLHLPAKFAEFAGRSFLYSSTDVKAESIIKMAASNRSAAAA
jgi:hypothetical protein